MFNKWRISNRPQRGDSLIEVVFALGILTLVLTGAIVVAMSSFRTGQTARERTTVSNEAQAQLEALRSFRDNHSWAEFRDGSGGTYSGVDTVAGSMCTFDPAKHCFHMVPQNTTPGTREWVPVAGSMPGSVPTSVIEIWADDSGPALAARPCNYDFELHYQFQPIGGGVAAANHIRTRLSNLKYAPPPAGLGVCL